MSGDEKLPSYGGGFQQAASLFFVARLLQNGELTLNKSTEMMFPWKSNHHLLVRLVSEPLLFKKGFIIFQKELPFLKWCLTSSFFLFWIMLGYCSVSHPKPEVGLGNGTLPETGLRGRQCSLALSKKVLKLEAFGKGVIHFKDRNG